jgi:FkbM family methyltransferase
MLFDAVYDLALKLPSFRGKARIEGVLRHLLERSVSKVDHDLAMALDPGEWLQIELRRHGCLEPRTTAVLKTILRPGDTYVDVGAHVGYHALLACRCVGASGRVFAIDPQPYNCSRLLTNAELNGFTNCNVVAAAVGSRADFVSLKKQSRTDSARLTLRGPGLNDGLVSFVVPVISLAWLMDRFSLRPVQLLKVDVEGLSSKCCKVQETPCATSTTSFSKCCRITKA